MSCTFCCFNINVRSVHRKMLLYDRGRRQHFTSMNLQLFLLCVCNGYMGKKQFFMIYCFANFPYMNNRIYSLLILSRVTRVRLEYEFIGFEICKIDFVWFVVDLQFGRWMLVNVNVAPQTVKEKFFVATVRALACFASRSACWDSFRAQIAILSVVNSVVDFETLLAWDRLWNCEQRQIQFLRFWLTSVAFKFKKVWWIRIVKFFHKIYQSIFVLRAQ